MKFAILICVLTIFGTCFAQSGEDGLDEARDRAYAATEIFMSNYSNLISGEKFMEMITKCSNIQVNLQTKNDEADQLIRTPYEEFNMNLSMGYGNGLEAECYYYATLNLYLDVARAFENSYEISSVYSRVISDLEVVSSSFFSDDFYALMERVYSTVYLPDITVAIIDTLIAQFNIDAEVILTRSAQLLIAVDTELDKVVTKFTDETAERVSRALDKLENIKHNYENCKAYEYY